MATRSEKERFALDLAQAACEAVNLCDIGASILPRLERALDTSCSLLYRYTSAGEIENLAGTQIGAHPEYVQEHYHRDPMQIPLKALNPWAFHARRHPEWKEMVKLPVYEFSLGQGINDYFLVRLSETDHDAPGMVGILLSRAKRQADFGEEDELLLARVLPALEQAVRRSLRIEAQLKTHPFLETILENDGQPKLALDFSGALLWCSGAARKVLEPTPGAKPEAPAALVNAARQLGKLYGKDAASAQPAVTVSVPRRGATPIRAELRVARTAQGRPFLIAEFESLGISPLLQEVALRFRLSVSETEVLSFLSRGLSDQQVGRRLFISLSTVRSHVGQILAKLGVRSRVQAALIAQGILPEAAEEDAKD